MLISIIILSLVVIFLIFIALNLYRKLNTFKLLTDNYQKMFYEIFSIIDHSEKTLEELDTKGSFSSDDEVGYFFDGIKEIQTLLSYFRKNVTK